jgi:hypothetical protein
MEKPNSTDPRVAVVGHTGRLAVKDLLRRGSAPAARHRPFVGGDAGRMGSGRHSRGYAGGLAAKALLLRLERAAGVEPDTRSVE